jgi:two-component sensor histidine kinase
MAAQAGVRLMEEARGEPARWLERLPIARDRPWAALGSTLAICAAALMLRLALGSVLPPGLPYATFFPAVIVTAFLFGVRAGLLAGILGGLLGWVFFIDNPLSVSPVKGTAPSILLYVVAVALNLLMFHWMQTATASLVRERERSRRLADTRELLFRELQHRVSNNLQVAAGLLALQKSHLADEGARAALGEASRRIGVIGRISRQLYRPDGGPQDLRALLEPLCADVVDAAGKPVSVAVEAEDGLWLPPDAAIPVALIVAEAVANAIEHGFMEREGGVIAVECARAENGGMVIQVRDDGKGLPEGFGMESHGSLGLRIATMLAAQLGGRFELHGGEGVIARLTLPL